MSTFLRFGSPEKSAIRTLKKSGDDAALGAKGTMDLGSFSEYLRLPARVYPAVSFVAAVLLFAPVRLLIWLGLADIAKKCRRPSVWSNSHTLSMLECASDKPTRWHPIGKLEATRKAAELLWRREHLLYCVRHDGGRNSGCHRPGVCREQPPGSSQANHRAHNRRSLDQAIPA